MGGGGGGGCWNWLGRERMGRPIFSLVKERSSPVFPRGKNWLGEFQPVWRFFWAPETNVKAWFLHKYLRSLKPLSNEQKLWSLNSVGPDQFASLGALEANWSVFIIKGMCIHGRFKSVCTTAQSDRSLKLSTWRNDGPLATHRAPIKDSDQTVCLFCCFTSQVNSYGHGGTVSSPYHTFSWASLNKQLTSTSCTYYRL